MVTQLSVYSSTVHTRPLQLLLACLFGSSHGPLDMHQPAVTCLTQTNPCVTQSDDAAPLTAPVIAAAACGGHLIVCAESLDASKHRYTLPVRHSIVALQAAAVERHLFLSELPAHFS